MQLLITLLLYLGPVFLFFYIAIEIYLKNKESLFNRITAAFFFTFMLYQLSEFLIAYLPYDYAFQILLYFKYPVLFGLLGISSHFIMTITNIQRKRIPFIWYAVCYFPTVVLLLLFFFFRETFTIKLIADGYHNIEDVSNQAFNRFLPFFSIIPSGIVIFFTSKAIVQLYHLKELVMERKQFQLLFIGCIVASAWTIVSSFFRNDLADFSANSQIFFPPLELNSIIILCLFIRHAMIKYDFLPSFENRYKTLFQLSPLGIVLLDKQGMIIELNSNAKELFEFSPNEWKKRFFASFLSRDEDDFHEHYQANFKKRKVFIQEEYTINNKAGKIYIVMLDSQYLQVKSELFQFIMISDITLAKQAEGRISYLAYHDSLTGLANRIFFQDTLTQVLSINQDSLLNSELEPKAAIMLLDLDRFKYINDTFGHDAGDKLLKHVAYILTAVCQSRGTVCRLGGDEFALLFNSSQQPDNLLEFANSLLSKLKTPFKFEEHEFYVTGSIGISISPEDGTTPSILLKKADIAMYQAKKQGRNKCLLYTPSMNQSNIIMLTMDYKLEKALERNEFELFYQPQFNLETGNVWGFEALIRWNSPQDGLIYPSEFIGLAEESGLIVPIGNWVLRNACEQASILSRMGFKDAIISVNISGRQLEQENFIPQLVTIIRDTGIEPSRLCLEITERIAIENSQLNIDLFKTITDLGVKLSLDDFGTGYSSLTLLKRFPFYSIKIDQSFVQNMVTS